MKPIADKIKGLDFVQLPCAPEASSINIQFDPAPPAAITYDIDPNDSARLVFSPMVPPGTKVNFDFKCPRN